ncbi:hypothetical protein BD560DRAFT_307710, partial [Blakeslea trispora]
SSSLIQHSINKVLYTMNAMTVIDVNRTGFSQMISSCFYVQITRPQMECWSVINVLAV